MRYHVIYLAAGDREAMGVEAPNAAAAVATVTELQHRVGFFELLSVVPVAEPASAPDPHAAPREGGRR